MWVATRMKTALFARSIRNAGQSFGLQANLNGRRHNLV